MKKALYLLIANIPSLAFLGSCPWCLNKGHTGFAVTCLVFAVCFRSYTDDAKERK